MCLVARAVGWATVAPNRPLALGLACAVALGLACMDAAATPLTCTSCPGASGVFNDPVAADAPPAAIATPSTPAAPMTISFLDTFIVSLRPLTVIKAIVEGKVLSSCDDQNGCVPFCGW